MKRILFVCMGNICRSPTAEGVFGKQLEKNALSADFQIDSAGTHAYHVGHSPDHRAQQASLKRGIDLSSQRARQVNDKDFVNFDIIVAMDNANLHDLKRRCPQDHQHKLMTMMSFTNSDYNEVPDPYYGAQDGFELVLDLLEQASEGLLNHLQGK